MCVCVNIGFATQLVTSFGKDCGFPVAAQPVRLRIKLLHNEYPHLGKMNPTLRRRSSLLVRNSYRWDSLGLSGPAFEAPLGSGTIFVLPPHR